MSTNQKISKKKSKTWIIALICLIVLGGGSFAWYWFNKPLFYAYYTDTFNNPFKPGDKLYITDFLVNKTSTKDFSRYNLPLYRSVRPMNDDEVDKMSISLADKILIKKDMSSKKPYMVECGWAISTDSLCKYRSAFISNYTESRIDNAYFGDNKYLPMIFFIVHPVQKALIRESNSTAPSGYVFDDNLPFYVDASDVQRQDSKNFREIK
ncbi:hypothetical protein [Mucilaginibacter sp. UR6-11]|uniref:hypothetical protein n=1 Tax=Mucilaginibacter sp. UR6-11 TaxID=1435644 RepID=UPI001E56071E|nr:hypothetical protein [Mucilaginibacter sp. UR6-11]MCC8427224.1 hypothetical protein [Mucilaginibacter sp. UR6-11]